MLFYAIFGAGSFQNSILEWSSDHRKHHKETDTEDDPYSASRGFWYSHIGWILVEEEKFQNDFSNVKDLQESKIIMWQHKHIFLIGALSGLILPALIGGIFGGIPGAAGCFAWAGLTRVVFVHHGTFLINSAAHIWGTQPYSEEDSSRDSFWLAFLTFGEGYHNFHHTFQADYRNGHKWYHVDPSKWWIKMFNLVGLNSNLKLTPKHTIEVAKVNMKFKKSAKRLEKRNISVHKFENRLRYCRNQLKSYLYDLQRTKKQLKNKAKKSNQALKQKITELKTSCRTVKDDLRELFKEMKFEYRKAKLIL